jgi:hypothetical protein
MIALVDRPAFNGRILLVAMPLSSFGAGARAAMRSPLIREVEPLIKRIIWRARLIGTLPATAAK